jgi:hypothetical protein
MKQFYLRLNNNQEGPFTVEDLKSQNITSDTPIWYPGLKNWINASEVDELAPLLSIQTPPPFQADTYHTSVEAQSVRKGFTTWGRFIRFAVGAGLLIWAFIAIRDYLEMSQMSENTSQESYIQKVMTVEEIEKANPLNFLDVSLSYREMLFSSKYVLNIDIKNSATVAYYKDVVVKINFLSRTGSEISSENHTLYEYFPPHSTKKFEFKVKKPKGAEKISYGLAGAQPH